MKDKVVIITGGSSGIGKALAEKFGQHGSKILITGTNSQNLNWVVKDLQQKGVVISCIIADVGKEDDNNRMVEEAVRLYGGIDVLINNAGVSMRPLFEELDLEVIRRAMDIN